MQATKDQVNPQFFHHKVQLIIQNLNFRAIEAGNISPVLGVPIPSIKLILDTLFNQIQDI